ncbi:hypothetical protein ACOMHN_019048 [Nucella lapillus]
MPAVPLLFRARCDSFVAVFIAFMFRRAKKKAELQCRTLRVRNRLDGVIVGLTLSVIFFSNLLMQCGDIESNPGPPKPANTRQTRLSSSSGSGRTGNLSLDSNASGSGDRGQNDSDTSLKDMMTEMMVGINARFDELQNDIREIRDSCAGMREDIESLKEEVATLKESNIKLEESVKKLEAKTDDLECRSKRNNMIIHGIPRHDKETAEDCENILRDTITDKLELTGDFCFERVHRLNAKKNSPVIACCSFYKDKVSILKVKWKLKGSDLFIGEDFSLRVRTLRKKLVPHLKAAKDQKKRAIMIYDYLIIDGKKYVLGDDDNGIVEVS